MIAMLSHKQILDWIDDHHVGLIEFAQKLIRITSITGHEGKELPELVATECQRLNLEVEVVEAEKNRQNIVSRYHGTTGKPCLLAYMHHYDHVPPGDLSAWKHGPYSGDIDEGLLWGRGSVKADCAAWLWAMRCLKDLEVVLKGDVIFTLACDEENGGHKGFRHLINEGYCDNADFMLMSGQNFGGEALIVACNERRIFRITVKGKVAHTARNEQGVNAIVEAAKLIPRLQKLADEVNKREYQYTMPNLSSVVNSRFSINTGYCGWGDDTVLSGVVSANTVPDKFVIDVDRRITPGETADQAMEEIQSIVDQLSSEDDGFHAEVTWDPILSVPGVVSPTNSLIARTVQEAATRVLGFTPHFRAMHGSSDCANFTHRTQKPHISVGIFEQPPGHTAHGSNEAFKIEGLINLAKIYALSIIGLLG